MFVKTKYKQKRGWGCNKNPFSKYSTRWTDSGVLGVSQFIALKERTGEMATSTDLRQGLKNVRMADKTFLKLLRNNLNLKFLFRSKLVPGRILDSLNL